MEKCLQNPRFGAAVWFFGFAFLWLSLLADGAPTRLLTEGEMTSVAKGALPLNCTDRLKAWACTDMGGWCTGYPQVHCVERGDCSGCSNQMELDIECDSEKPWTIVDCFPQAPEVDGCGYLIAFKECAWSEGSCKCSGGIEYPESFCNQHRATFGTGCNIIP
jgi:hypothetical protein